MLYFNVDRWCDRKNNIGNSDGWISTLMNSRCPDGDDKWRCVIGTQRDSMKKKINKIGRINDGKNLFFSFSPPLVQD